MSPAHASRLRPRAGSSTETFLDLIQDPYGTQLGEKAFWSSLGYSLGAAIIFALLFCLLRPYNSAVYAPRLKHADEKHAPPPVTKGVFAWVQPVVKTREQMLVAKIGLDATVFLRFTKMCRNIFIILSLLGCGIYIPLNLVENAKNNSTDGDTFFKKLTPLGVWGKACWAHVLLSYLFNGIICFFIWTNYRAVTRLRRDYFESPDYQAGLHARTLMVTDIPRGLRTDEGVVKIVDEVKATEEHPRGVIARNVKDLPQLIEEHEEAVRDLEEVLAKYLRNPNRLPAKRPTCRSHKNDRSYTKRQSVDAIDYLTSRIKSLEIEISEVRLSVDNRNALPYGFASYESIEDAHGVAFAAQKQHPQGSSVRLAPKPSDVIWKNLPLDKKARRWRSIVNNVWVLMLTMVWTVPNALIAVFLANLSNLGLVWRAFQTELARSPKTWAAVQGIAAPLITTLFYFFLPIIFRRLSMNAGDYSKTSRERHVTHKLYSFFIFNNLIVFSLFSTAWKFGTTIENSEQEEHLNAWDAIVKADIFGNLMTAFCDVSPFWLNYLLQRNFGAAWDISQLGNMAWGYVVRTFTNPTPRRLIELTAPPAFDYACYYNYFLFYSTIALVFAPFQPLVLPVAALYFLVDSYLKKYLLLYVFITKHESGGSFWRVLINRMLFAAFFANVVAALFVIARKSGYDQLVCMVPLPFMIGGFKWYVKRTFDDDQHFYSKGNMKGREDGEEGLPERRKHRGDRVGVRFGNPALYQPLMTPMVHAKSQHLLREVYRGRLDADDADGASVAGYSDTYNMQRMSRNQPGKTAAGDGSSPFEFVSDVDFENFRNRPEFREQFGGDGELYGRPSDMSRPGTPATFRTGLDGSNSRPGSPAAFFAGGHRSSTSQDSQRTFTEHDGGMTYPAGYHMPASSAVRSYSPLRRTSSEDTGNNANNHNFSAVNLVGGAAPMGSSSSSGGPFTMSGGNGRGGYGRLDSPPPPADGVDDENTSYDFFRRGRRRDA